VRERFRDFEHLIRLVLLFGAGTLLFLGVRAVMVPPGFGEYGHFRPGALDDNAAREPLYAGRERCVECHDEVVKKKAADKHAGVGCESCHGPLAAHANDPDAVKPELPKVATLCVRCHSAVQSRPATFPQVEPKSHSEGSPCNDCHDPHAPAP
jgi:predicted CXXCH cytochrome family protein